jgi:glycosyltransferase involved in cell wall biosynthesis
MNISIVTPVYNEPRIRYTLESILSQQGVPNTEIIVIDGNSTDKTPAIIEEYATTIDIHIREPDEGIYDAINKGIEYATGDIIGVLNADDRYQGPHVLRSIIKEFETSGAELCYGNLVYVNDDDDVVRYWKSGEYHQNRFYFGWVPPHPTVFVKRNVYEKYSRFDLDFSIAADYELLLRLLFNHEVSTSYIDKVLVRMATGGRSNSSISNIIKANLEVYNAWSKNNLRGGLLVPFLKPLRKVPQFLRSREKDST